MTNTPDTEFITYEKCRQAVLDGKVVFFHHQGQKVRIFKDTTTGDLRRRHFGQYHLTINDITTGKYSVAEEPTAARYLERAAELRSDVDNRFDYSTDIQDLEVLDWLISQAERTKSLQEQLDAKIVFVNNGWEEERYALQEEVVQLRYSDVSLEYSRMREALENLNHSLYTVYDGDLSKEMKYVLTNFINRTLEDKRNV